jgi:hypothetical protein
MAGEHPDAMVCYIQRLVETQPQQGGSDGQLLQSFAMQRDEKAFAALVRRHGRLVWGMATGKAVHRIKDPGMRKDHPSFAYSPDSRTLAVGDAEGTIHLLELATGKFRRHLTKGHQGSISALLFSADGQRLISGSTDTTALVWDLTGRLHGNPKPLNRTDLDACWADLAGADAEAAYQAIRRLAASPTDMLPYLDKQLKPVVGADARRVARLIADLDSEQFAVRERAFKELEGLGETAFGTLRQALASKPALELRRRLEMLLEKQEERWSPSPERLRTLRALEAVEAAGTPQARQLLRKLAGGATEVFLTREAKAALERLDRRSESNAGK